MNNYLRNDRVYPLIGRQPLLIPLFSLDDINSKQQRKARKNDESFYNIMKPIITISQFFGHFSINGIQDSEPDEYVFKFTSLITCYSLMIITLIGCYFTLRLFAFIKSNNSTEEKIFKKLLGTVFVGYNFLVQLIIFCKLPSWIKLQKNWQQFEEKLDNFHRTKFCLRSKLQKITLILFLPALIEHIYSYSDPISRMTSAKEYFISICSKNILSEIFGSLKEISNNYQLFLGVFFSMIRTITTFTWNLCDFLIILVSIGLAERYKQLNKIVSYKITNSLAERINWCKIKEKYVIMNELVKEADDIVSPLILLSCCINVYMICVQTSEGIRSVAIESKLPIYYFWSLFSFFLRTIVVYSAARINDESGHALSIFARCHPSVFIIEVIWMQQKFSINRVSFTAMKFFPITRKFILTIVGTIVTYEIVYMQFRSIH